MKEKREKIQSEVKINEKIKIKEMEKRMEES